MKNEDFASYRRALGGSFTIATVGTAVLTLVAALNLITFLYDGGDVSLMGWLYLTGAAGILLFGAGMVSAGRKLCTSGHRQTGVTSAGVSLILVALVQIVGSLHISSLTESFNISTAFQVEEINILRIILRWHALTIIGLFAACYFLWHRKGKFFSTASSGMCLIILVNVLMLAAIKVMPNPFGDHFTSPTLFKIGVWLLIHWKEVTIVYLSAIILGWFLCLLSIGGYGGFLKDLEEENKAKEREQFVDEALAEYNERHANDAAAEEAPDSESEQE